MVRSMLLENKITTSAKRSLHVLFSISFVFISCITPVHSEEAESSQQPQLDEVMKNIQSTKEKLLRDPRGIAMEYTFSAFEDPRGNFGFQGDHTVKNVIKWPQLYIDATGVNIEDGSLFHRTSVYDFMRHRTIALDRPQQKAVIYPARFLFSSAHSIYYKNLHYAEGHQLYRFGLPFSQAPTIPECFSSGNYQVAGIEDVDGESCIHIQHAGFDDIWISKEHGFHVHKRVVTYGPDQPRQFETLVLSYQLIDQKKNLWAPMKIRRKEYFGIDSEAELHDQVRLGLEINVTKISIGDIDESVFALHIPNGFHVSDLLIEEKYYVKNPPFDGAVSMSTWIAFALIFVSFIVVFLVISLSLFKRNGTKF